MLLRIYERYNDATNITGILDYMQLYSNSMRK